MIALRRSRIITTGGTQPMGGRSSYPIVACMTNQLIAGHTRPPGRGSDTQTYRTGQCFFHCVKASVQVGHYVFLFFLLVVCGQQYGDEAPHCKKMKQNNDTTQRPSVARATLLLTLLVVACLVELGLFYLGHQHAAAETMVWTELGLCMAMLLIVLDDLLRALVMPYIIAPWSQWLGRAPGPPPPAAALVSKPAKKEEEKNQAHRRSSTRVATRRSLSLRSQSSKE